MSKKPNRRISQQDMFVRMVSLEVMYGGQKGLAKYLGISPSTERRYRDKGNINPKAYEKINRTYNRYKNTIDPEAVRKRIEEIERAKEGRKHEPQYVTIEDYINYSPYKRYMKNGMANIEKLLRMGESGYMFSYIGNKNHIPLEGQFLIHGEVPGERIGKFVKILGVISHDYEPEAGDEDEDADSTNITVTLSKNIFSLGIIPSKFRTMTLEERHDIFRTAFFETEFKSGMPKAYLGFYFLEGDEM